MSPVQYDTHGTDQDVRAAARRCATLSRALDARAAVGELAGEGALPAHGGLTARRSTRSGPRGPHRTTRRAAAPAPLTKRYKTLFFYLATVTHAPVNAWGKSPKGSTRGPLDGDRAPRHAHQPRLLTRKPATGQQRAHRAIAPAAPVRQHPTDARASYTAPAPGRRRRPCSRQLLSHLRREISRRRPGLAAIYEHRGVRPARSCAYRGRCMGANIPRPTVYGRVRPAMSTREGEIRSANRRLGRRPAD